MGSMHYLHIAYASAMGDAVDDNIRERLNRDAVEKDFARAIETNGKLLTMLNKMELQVKKYKNINKIADMLLRQYKAIGKLGRDIAKYE